MIATIFAQINPSHWPTYVLLLISVLVLFAIVIADARQHSDPDLWGHVLFGRQLLAHGSLPRDNPYSYSAPGFPWLHHEWLSEVLMGALFEKFGTAGLKLLKFACTAGTVSFIALAEAETIAPALVQLSILLAAAETIIKTFEMVPPNNCHNAKTAAAASHVNESACTTDEQDEAALAALVVRAPLGVICCLVQLLERQVNHIALLGLCRGPFA